QLQRGDPVEVTTPRRRRGRGGALAVLVALAAPLALGGCSATFGLPPSATSEGDEVTWLWRTLIIMAGLVTLLIWVLTAMVVVSSIRRRRVEGRDGVPAQHQYRVGLEIFYTATPLLIVMGILGMTFVVTQR